MYRRRQRPAREPAFGFDSFLDVVTNVVGIIIRLILVAWVGARAYSSLVPEADEPASAAQAKANPGDEPVSAELAQTRHDLEQARRSLLKRVGELRQTEAEKLQVQQVLAAVQADRLKVQHDKTQADQQHQTPRVPVPAPPPPAPPPPAPPAPDLTLLELRRRSQALTEQIQTLSKLPSLRKTFRYHAPVSRPVHADELMFECQDGRVSCIDLAGFMNEVQARLPMQEEQLKRQWQVTEVAGPIGAFRLRYILERERGFMESGALPPESGRFRYGLTSWVLEPIMTNRGEPRDRALSPGSDFRRILDSQDLRNTVVTFWVYPDSFALFRELRDYLYERGAEVAGRPLPFGRPIAASRHGSASRGQ